MMKTSTTQNQKRIKYIKRNTIFQMPDQNLKNMFHKKTTQSISYNKKYSMVGQSFLKNTLSQDKTMLPQLTTYLPQSIHHTQHVQFIIDVKPKNLSGNKLFKCNRNYIDRQKRTLCALSKYNKQWQQFQTKINKKMNRKKYSSLYKRPNIIYEQNPQKEQLIKKNQKLYWQMSLRNNNKIILKHLTDVPVQSNQFIRHLQTNNGTMLLENKVPKLFHKVDNNETIQLKANNKSINKSRRLMTLYDIHLQKPYIEETLKTNWKNKDLSKIYHQ